MKGFYCCIVTIHRFNPQGWRIDTQLPTFYLNEDVQGIISTKHAEAIVQDMLEKIVGSPVSAAIQAVRQVVD